MFSLEDIESIYFSKTKEYFAEVFSSYSIGNYRSCLVVLYSVVITDLCLKINELDTVYADKKANKLLKELATEQKNNASKSSWEKWFIDELGKRGFIDDKLHSDIDHLYSDRNFCAHPAMSNNFELITPNKETVLAHVKNMLEQLFIMPPMFSSNIVYKLTDELKSRAAIFRNDLMKLDSYVQNVYFSKLTDAIKISSFNSLWKLAFKSKDDNECKTYADLLLRTISVLYKNNQLLILNHIRKGGDLKFDNEAWCMEGLCAFLYLFPECYSKISDEDKPLLESYASENADVGLIAYYMRNSVSEHLEGLINQAKLDSRFNKPATRVNPESIGKLFEKCKEEGCTEQFASFCVEVFRHSFSFAFAVENFCWFIAPYLYLFSLDQLESALSACENNYQLSQNYEISTFCNAILERIEKITGETPNVYGRDLIKCDERYKKKPEPTK